MILEGFYNFKLSNVFGLPLFQIEGNYRPFADLQKDEVFLLNGLPLRRREVNIKGNPYRLDKDGQTVRDNLDLLCKLEAELVRFDEILVEDSAREIFLATDGSLLPSKIIPTFAIDETQIGGADADFIKMLYYTSNWSTPFERSVLCKGKWYGDMYKGIRRLQCVTDGYNQLSGLSEADEILVNNRSFLITEVDIEQPNKSITLNLQINGVRSLKKYKRLLWLPPEKMYVGGDANFMEELQAAWVSMPYKNEMWMIRSSIDRWREYKPVAEYNAKYQDGQLKYPDTASTANKTIGQMFKAETKAEIKTEIKLDTTQSESNSVLRVIREDALELLQIEGPSNLLGKIEPGSFVSIQDKLFVVRGIERNAVTPVKIAEDDLLGAVYKQTSDTVVLTLSLFSGVLPVGSKIQYIEIEADDINTYGLPPVLSDREQQVDWGVNVKGIVTPFGSNQARENLKEVPKIERNPLREVRRAIEFNDD